MYLVAIIPIHCLAAHGVRMRSGAVAEGQEASIGWSHLTRFVGGEMIGLRKLLNTLFMRHAGISSALKISAKPRDPTIGYGSCSSPPTY